MRGGGKVRLCGRDLARMIVGTVPWILRENEFLMVSSGSLSMGVWV